MGRVLELVAAALDGSGDALVPVPTGSPGRAALGPLAPGTPLAPGEDDDADPTALVLATSGSTGVPKGALLQSSALTASATATAQRLGGHGSWLLALAPHHVAGVQVLVRSILAGTTPEVLDLANGFSPKAFVRGTDRVQRQVEGPRYTSLVPTQLVRLLDAGPDARAALSSYDAVLVGAAATPAPLLERAREAGVRVVTTYGMSETCGGCVYDGVALDGVDVEVDADGRVLIGGPVVARGYRLQPRASAFVERDGRRWFCTDDLGELVDGRLRVVGRADDVIVTGGLKVSPAAVEAVLSATAEVSECVVVGVPDDEWGQAVVAVIVAGPTMPVLQQVRAFVTEQLGAEAAPRWLVVVDELPLRGPGKPDRAAAVTLAAQAGEG